MKKNLLKTIALGSALAMAFPVFAACGGNNETKVSAESYVAIDINPSISLTLDEENKVISVHATNEDAQIMLYGEALEGLSLEVAIDKIAELSMELGFINDDNYGINFNVSGSINENTVKGTLEAAFDKHSGEFNVNFSTEGTFSDLRELEAIKAKYIDNLKIQALTIEEYKLIVEAQLIDATLTVEEAVEMKVEELMNIIAEGAIAIEPYATEAYNIAIGVAERAYNEFKGQLLDALWLVPYTKDLANIFTGRQYPIHNGALYNMYTSSSRALGVGIDAIETAIKVANEMAVPTSVVDEIAVALNLTEEQKALFVEEITVDGVVTLASLEGYLNKWFKNMTEDERAAVKATIDEIMAKVQAFAVEIDNAVAQEYKDAVVKLAEDLTSLIPEELTAFLGSYVTEFKNLVDKISGAVDSKEPLAAIKAVKEVFDEEAARIMQTMRDELTAEDLQDVEDSIAKVSSTLKGYEDAFNEAKAKAEADAKAWLEEQKAKRA